ncbi:MAG: hypothetical protein AAF664_00905 [Planctomycetota bacterium]
MIHRSLLRLLSVVGLAVCWFPNTSALAQAKADSRSPILAGAAISDITPPLGLPIVGGWNSPPAQVVHDPIQVRSLVIANGGKERQKLAWAICDSVGIPAEVFDIARRQVVDQIGISADAIMMSSTHTHSSVSAAGTRWVDGVPLLDDYQTRVAAGIVEAIVNANNRLQPAKISWGGVDEAGEVHNRRWFVGDAIETDNPFGGEDQVRFNPPEGHSDLIKPAGPIDPEISFISVHSIDDQPIAVLANYSLHYVGGVPSNHLSADYFAAFADQLSDNLEATSPDTFVGIMTNGTSGDINNFHFHDPLPPMEPYENIQRVAKVVADRVTSAMDDCEYRTSVKLDAAVEIVPLKVRKPSDEMLLHFQEVRRKVAAGEKVYRYAETYANRVEELKAGPDFYNVRLQVLRIDDLMIAGIPFEVFAEIGISLKEKNQADDCFVVSLCGGSFGYLPTRRQHKLGGYETWMGTNRVQFNASDLITESILKMMNRLYRAEEEVEVKDSSDSRQRRR